MRIRRSLCATIVATSILAGCTSYRGANRLHDNSEPGKRAEFNPAYKFFRVREMFIDDLKGLLDERKGSAEANPVQMKRLLNSGFSLIRLNCNEYFNQMGRNQRNSAVLRDLIKPVTDAVNMVIGLKLLSDRENVNADLVTGFAGLSSAATSGLTIYDRHFLFDHDNIAAVRTMTMTALAENRAAAYESLPDDVLLAVGQLQENENICTPAQILSNVRETIKKGDFENKTSGSDDDGKRGEGETGVEGGKKDDTKSDKVPNGSEVVTTTPSR